MRKRQTKILIIVLLELLLNISFSTINAQSDLSIIKQREIEYLVAFSKLYGYTKYFHPSDEVVKLDWEKFAYYGVEKIKDIKNEKELTNTLAKLFLPLAPTAQILYSGEKLQSNNQLLMADTIDQRSIAWQHFGVWLSGESNIYRSIRVFIDAPVLDERQLQNSSSLHDKLDAKVIQSIRLFENIPFKNECIEYKFSDSLQIKIPLTVYYTRIGTVDTRKEFPFNELLEKINTVDLTGKTADDENIRLVNVIMVWNVFQHFYPYFEVINIDWDKVLHETLMETFLDKTSNEFYNTLRKMVAKLMDGHTFITCEPKQKLYGLPFKVDWVENKVVITSSDDSLFAKGDIINFIDSKTPESELSNGEKYVPGSLQLKRYLSLIEFGNGSEGSVAKLEISREDESLYIEKKRESKASNYFRNRLFEFNYPSIKKIEKGIYYINLLTITEKDFNDSLMQLSKADGIVFDFRWVGKQNASYTLLNRMILLRYLINSTVDSPIWDIPSITTPDHKKMNFIGSKWSLQPAYPHFRSYNVFIDDPNVISSMETFMSIIEHYKLGDIIGGTTAGTNGNVNFIPLPGGFEIMFTGMKVLKLDGSQHHLIGVKPTYPVQRTIKAVKEGRDEYLEKAIEVLKGKIKN
ncbi:MAG: S41 family peptidase [Melioribacteraceae bacterium]